MTPPFPTRASSDLPPISSESELSVPGVKVDVSGDCGAQARDAAWRLAQLKGWRMLWQKMNPGTAVPALGDSALQGMVSGIVVEKEQIGSNRYIASLGVLFDRARTGQLLGVRARSEARRVGQECVGKCRSRWSPSH